MGSEQPGIVAAEWNGLQKMVILGTERSNEGMTRLHDEQ